MALPNIATLIADDMDFMDAIETCTVLQRDADDLSTTATANDVTILKRTTLEAATGVGEEGEVPSKTTRFHLKANTIAFVPKKRDLIETDDGKKWNIDRVTRASLGSRYLCEATETV